MQIMANFILKLVVLFVFGFWYAVRENKWHYRPDYRPLFTVKRIAGLTAIGLFGQYAIGITVGFLRYLLPNIFASYDNVSEILSLKNGSPFAVLLLVVVVGPIAEELLFRGVIYGGLRTCFPVDVSALVSALILVYTIKILFRDCMRLPLVLFWRTFLKNTEYLGKHPYAYGI